MDNPRQFFEQSVTAMMERLYGTAMRFTRDPMNAEDLLAETLEKAWKNLSSLEDPEKFEGWIMRILSNSFISQWRKNKTHDKVFDDDVEACDLDETQSLYAKLHQPFLLWWGTPEQAFLNNLVQEDIEKALDSLPDHYRVVVIMVQLMGFSYEEVANKLEVPVGTVRSRLNRARNQLQEALWQHSKQADFTSAS